MVNFVLSLAVELLKLLNFVGLEIVEPILIERLAFARYEQFDGLHQV